MKTGMSGSNRRGEINAKHGKETKALAARKKAYYAQGQKNKADASKGLWGTITRGLASNAEHNAILKQEESLGKKRRVRYGDKKRR